MCYLGNRVYGNRHGGDTEAGARSPENKYYEEGVRTMAAFDTGNEHIAFNYGVQMKPAQFKSNMSEIALSLGESLKYGGPEVKEAIRSGVGPSLTKPAKPELQTIEGVKQTEIDIMEDMEIYKFEMPQYLKDKCHQEGVGTMAAFDMGDEAHYLQLWCSNEACSV